MPKHSSREEYNTYMRVYMLNRYHKRRSEAIDQLGGVCVICGGSESLEFDHIDPFDKVMSFAKIWSYSKARFEAELAKMQLLCAPCHKEKTRINGDVAKGKERERTKIKPL